MSNSAICGTYVTTGCEKPIHGACECCEEHCQCHATTIGIVTCPQCPAREDWERLTAEIAEQAKREESWAVKFEEQSQHFAVRLEKALKQRDAAKAELEEQRNRSAELHQSITAYAATYKAAARESWQALDEMRKVADAELSCWVTSNSLPPEIESLYASTQDLRELLAKYADLLKETKPEMDREIGERLGVEPIADWVADAHASYPAFSTDGNAMLQLIDLMAKQGYGYRCYWPIKTLAYATFDRHAEDYQALGDSLLDATSLAALKALRSEAAG